MARAAVHEEEDDALRFGREMRRARRERIGGGPRGLGGEEAVLREQGGQRDPGEACPGFPEKLAAGAAAEGGGRFGLIHGFAPSNNRIKRLTDNLATVLRSPFESRKHGREAREGAIRIRH